METNCRISRELELFFWQHSSPEAVDCPILYEALLDRHFPDQLADRLLGFAAKRKEAPKMGVLPLSFKLMFFTDLSDIKATPEAFPPLLSLFSDVGLLPSTIQEVRRRTVPNLRPRLSSPNGEWQVIFGSDRISIVKSLTDPTGSNMGTPQEFVANANGFLGRLLDRFPRKATRLALITEEFLMDIPDQELEASYELFLRPLSLHKKALVSEWKARSSARVELEITGHQETLNVITDVSRARGELAARVRSEGAERDEVQGFDGIRVEFDINTFQDRVDQRFDLESMKDFSAKALDLRAGLFEEVRNAIST